jgi:hypothetical protein
MVNAIHKMMFTITTLLKIRYKSGGDGEKE